MANQQQKIKFPFLASSFKIMFAHYPFNHMVTESNHSHLSPVTIVWQLKWSSCLLEKQKFIIIIIVVCRYQGSKSKQHTMLSEHTNIRLQILYFMFFSSDLLILDQMLMQLKVDHIYDAVWFSACQSVVYRIAKQISNRIEFLYAHWFIHKNEISSLVRTSFSEMSSRIEI